MSYKQMQMRQSSDGGSEINEAILRFSSNNKFFDSEKSLNQELRKREQKSKTKTAFKS